MTLAAMLVQITYLLYVYIDEVTDMLGDSDLMRRFKSGGKSMAIAAYVFYVLGEYLTLYLSRTREYYADHFAAEMTGNPNGLSRALVKIAYGIVEEGSRNPQPSKILQGTRSLGITDPRSAAVTGTAYRVASEPAKVGRVFLWDMFNPWAGWMELNSTHPLTGNIIGRGDTGNKFGSDLTLQDPTGLMLLRYSSRFGPLGNLLFGWSQADSFMYRSVGVTGWFRRGIMPLVDLVRMDCPDKWTVHSYHRFWSLLWGAALILLSFVLPPILPV